MSHGRPTSILLNIGHAMDHWILVVFAYSWGIVAGVSVYIAQRFGWQMAFVLPGVISLLCAVAFVLLVPREEEAPAKRKPKMIDLPPRVMARVFAIMTFTAVTGSIVFNFTTNGHGELW